MFDFLIFLIFCIGEGGVCSKFVICYYRGEIIRRVWLVWNCRKS